MHRPEQASQKVSPTNPRRSRDPKKNAEAITAVRDLLFGEDLGDVEERMGEMEATISGHLEALRQEMTELKELQASQLKAALRSERSETKSELAAAKKEITGEVRTLKKSTDVSIRNLKESRVTRKAMAEILETAAASLRADSKEVD